MCSRELQERCEGDMIPLICLWSRLLLTVPQTIQKAAHTINSWGVTDLVRQDVVWD